ncbi:molybdopterin molybdotransferase MoeA [Lysinimonas soli]|uniref:Molybdopterin molybdenumtransferase n=1 Tax=Lysinimonas soli TaxID=1074233 RepID=A0ABW0NM64_9MICO
MTSGSSDVIDWSAARRLAFDAAAPLGAEQVGLAGAIGRVLFRDVAAAQDIPHFASSAMDGWAVAGPPPWSLDVEAGAVLLPRTACPVVTGGTIPLGADAVVRAEHGRLVGRTLTLADDGRLPIPGADIRSAGEEARAGDTLIAAGTLLNPAHIAVAASCARDLLDVATRPRVALLLTGDEVDESGLPPSGRVRDSFGPQLPAVISMMGGTVVAHRRVPDRLAETIRAIEAPGAEAELILTTGGTGFSSADQVRPALASLGAEMLVARLGVRPGGPSLLARLPDGRVVVGLAGNPLAAVIGALLLAAPLISGWTGRPLGGLSTVRPAHAIPGHARATLFVPYRTVGGVAVLAERVGSGMMRGLAESNGILVIPPTGLEPGESATALTLPWSEPSGSTR